MGKELLKRGDRLTVIEQRYPILSAPDMAFANIGEQRRQQIDDLVILLITVFQTAISVFKRLQFPLCKLRRQNVRRLISVRRIVSGIGVIPANALLIVKLRRRQCLSGVFIRLCRRQEIGGAFGGIESDFAREERIFDQPVSGLGFIAGLGYRADIGTIRVACLRHLPHRGIAGGTSHQRRLPEIHLRHVIIRLAILIKGVLRHSVKIGYRFLVSSHHATVIPHRKIQIGKVEMGFLLHMGLFTQQQRDSGLVSVQFQQSQPECRAPSGAKQFHPFIILLLLPKQTGQRLHAAAPAARLKLLRLLLISALFAHLGDDLTVARRQQSKIRRTVPHTLQQFHGFDGFRYTRRKRVF